MNPIEKLGPGYLDLGIPAQKGMMEAMNLQRQRVHEEKK